MLQKVFMAKMFSGILRFEEIMKHYRFLSLETLFEAWLYVNMVCHYTAALKRPNAFTQFKRDVQDP